MLKTEMYATRMGLIAEMLCFQGLSQKPFISVKKYPYCETNFIGNASSRLMMFTHQL
jgi:hypothetical protein